MKKVWLGVIKDAVHQDPYSVPHEHVVYVEEGDMLFEDFAERARFIGTFGVLGEIYCDEDNIHILWLCKDNEYYILIGDKVGSELYKLCKF